MANPAPIKQKPPKEHKPNNAPAGGIDPKKHPKVSAAGLSALKNQVAQAKSFVASYEKILADLDAAQDSANFWSNMVLAGQLTVGVCDGMVAVLAEMTGVTGKAVKEAYGATKPFATMAGDGMAGNAVSKADIHKGMMGAAGAAAKIAAGRVPGMHGSGAQTVFELSVDAKVHIGNAVIDAINHEEYKLADNLQAGAAKVVIATTGPAVGLGSRSALLKKAAEKSKLVAKGGEFAKGFGDAAGLIAELMQTGSDLGAHIGQWSVDKAENKQYFDAQKKAISAKLKQIKNKVRLLEQEIIKLEGIKYTAWITSPEKAGVRAAIKGLPPRR